MVWQCAEGHKFNSDKHVLHQFCPGCEQTTLCSQVPKEVPEPEFAVVKLTQSGLTRVLNSAVGMVFAVDTFTPSHHGEGQLNAHVRDYRFGRAKTAKGFAVWTLAPNDYEIVSR